MKKPILLVNLSLADISTTPFFVAPVGLLSIAAYLLHNNIPVHLIDFNVIKRKNKIGSDYALLQKFADDLKEIKPGLVGFSTMVAGQFALAEAAARSVKQLCSNTLTVVGGAHVSQFPKEILQNCPAIDLVVIGEGEEQSIALAQLTQNETYSGNLKNGWAYRLDNRIIIEPKTSFIDDLNALPFPAYDLLNLNDYLHDTSTWHNPFKTDFGVRVPIITSRGCPNSCTFCSVSRAMGFCYRPLKAAKVVDLMQRLYENNGIRTFVIYDANFAQEIKRVNDICTEILKRNLKLTIDLPTGLALNSTTKGLIDGLVEAGLIRTCVSVESGDLFIRNDVMKKRIHEDEALEVITAIRKYRQLFLMTDFVMGMPEETKESLDASVEFIEQLDTDDIDLSIATPYPGTELFAQCERDGLFFPDVNKDSLYRSDQFTHSNRKRFIIKPHRLDYETLCNYRDKILALRIKKISSYHKRMKEVFGVDSKYRTELLPATANS